MTHGPSFMVFSASTLTPSPKAMVDRAKYAPRSFRVGMPTMVPTMAAITPDPHADPGADAPCDEQHGGCICTDADIGGMPEWKNAGKASDQVPGRS